MVVLRSKTSAVVDKNSKNITIIENNNLNNIDNLNNKKFLAILIFEYCKDCIQNMASLPQGAFAACKLRQYSENKDTTISRIQSGEKRDTKVFANKKLMEYTPARYNSKLMNSIWGFYNRYSPHNIKGNDDNQNGHLILQQSMTVASYAIAENMAIAFKGNEWKFSDKK